MNVTVKSHSNAALNPRAQIRATLRDLMNDKAQKAVKNGLTAL